MRNLTSRIVRRLLGRRRLGRYLIVPVLALSTMTGCYGPFNLTRNVHHWNGEVGGEWTNEGVFLVLVFFPVYSFASFLDAVIFNSVEFWTGDNLIEPYDGGGGGGAGGELTKTFTDGDRTVVITRSLDEANRLTVRFIEKGEEIDTLTLESVPGQATRLRDSSGAVLGVARTGPDGSLVLVGEDGTVQQNSSVDDLNRLRARLTADTPGS